MKALPIFLLAGCSLFMGGCETQQLTVEQDGPELAPSLGVDASDIHFLSYGEFGSVRTIRSRRAMSPFNSNTVTSVYGIVALTPSDLRFINEERERLVTITIPELHAILQSKSQLQLKYSNQTAVMKLYGSSSNKHSQQALIEKLTAHGVPVYEATQTYAMKLSSDSRWTDSDAPTTRMNRILNRLNQRQSQQQPTNNQAENP